MPKWRPCCLGLHVWNLVNGTLHACAEFMVIWWRHQMETFSALLVICAGNSSVTGEFPAQRTVTRIFDVFFDLRRHRAHYDVTVMPWTAITVHQTASRHIFYIFVHCLNDGFLCKIFYTPWKCLQHVWYELQLFISWCYIYSLFVHCRKALRQQFACWYFRVGLWIRIVIIRTNIFAWKVSKYHYKSNIDSQS